ncbi:MAG: ATP-binding cassette domain-containing protein [Desulfurococcaceae archaeon]
MRATYMSLLKLVNVWAKYSNEYVLKGVNIEVSEGMIILIRGRSGVGKTTLAKAASMIMKPINGSVIYRGVDVWTLSEQWRALTRLREVGYVDQECMLLSELTVYENIELPLKIMGVSRGERVRIVREVVEVLELNGLENYYPDQLSGGQRQRAAIARALVKKPKLIVADEPYSNLDDETMKIVHSYIRSIVERERAAAVITTVDLHTYYDVDKEYILENGLLRTVKA